jgi:FKBP-type peptidyl-prolyl cis-trans isomerase 2
MREGDGGKSPRKGDELLMHVIVRTGDEQERLLSSTRASGGGRDVPLRALLGDSCKLLRGVELSVAAFTRGERAVLLLPPEFAYGARKLRACRGAGC